MLQSHRKRYLIVSLCMLLIILCGCATVPYEYGNNIENEYTLELRAGEHQFERGRPIWWLDGLGHYVFSLPSKLLLLNWKVDNHNISEETEEKLRHYLADNDLHNVKVRLNQYSPGREYSRLFRNQGMNGFWRFTLGMISVTYYTIFPGRLLGGDNYNPYTNTINLYSDLSAIALHEAGHAKDFTKQSRGFRGWYAALRMLPLVPLYQEAVATGDAIGYDIENEKYKDQKSDYEILYPAYCTYIAGEALRWYKVNIWVEYAIKFAAVVPGHILGRIKAAMVEEKQPPGEESVSYAY